VIIAPSGILHYLPFEVLLTDTVAAQRPDLRFADLPYLLRQVDVSYIPSVSALARLRGTAADASPSSRSALLLVGDPLQPNADQLSVMARLVLGDEAAPLTYASEEMNQIRAMVGGQDSRILQGTSATAANVQLAGQTGPYRFVHFTVHGVFNERRPQYSGLLLSRDVQHAHDGFVTTGEVFGWNLECDQVVLSACASALGEHIGGEGLVGLTRGLLFAGARSVVSALWDVSGQVSWLFMSEFYRELAGQDGKDRAHCLAAAKRRMITGAVDSAALDVVLAHPFCWAAFVMSGDSR
jgi:CHAT domain-containing protein